MLEGEKKSVLYLSADDQNTSVCHHIKDDENSFHAKNKTYKPVECSATNWCWQTAVFLPSSWFSIRGCWPSQHPALIHFQRISLGVTSSRTSPPFMTGGELIRGAPRGVCISSAGGGPLDINHILLGGRTAAIAILWREPRRDVINVERLKMGEFHPY